MARPRKGRELGKTVSFTLSGEVVTALNLEAKLRGKSRSALLEQILRSSLVRRGRSLAAGSRGR